jgi:hypothetical protein
MNRQFVIENSFYSLILLWQWLYYNDNFYPTIKEMVVPEMIFVFFPYVLRINWPKTRFRDSLESTRSKTHKTNSFTKSRYMLLEPSTFGQSIILVGKT